MNKKWKKVVPLIAIACVAVLLVGGVLFLKISSSQKTTESIDSQKSVSLNIREGDPISYIHKGGSISYASEGEDVSYQYDRQKAIDYARSWFGAYNPEFYSYSQDCANFVSQCLWAGGLPMTAPWHSTVDGKTLFTTTTTNEDNNEQTEAISPSWRLAQKLFAYYANPQNPFINGSVIALTPSSNVKETLVSATKEGKPIMPGDLLFFAPEGEGSEGINHAVFITDVSEDEIGFTSHNCSKLNEYLSSHLSHKDAFIIRLNTTR